MSFNLVALPALMDVRLLPNALHEPAKAGRQRALKISGFRGQVGNGLHGVCPRSVGQTFVVWPHMTARKCSLRVWAGEEGRGVWGAHSNFCHTRQNAVLRLALLARPQILTATISVPRPSDSCIGVSFTDCSRISLTSPGLSHPQCFLSFPILLPAMNVLVLLSFHTRAGVSAGQILR